MDYAIYALAFVAVLLAVPTLNWLRNRSGDPVLAAGQASGTSIEEEIAKVRRRPLVTASDGESSGSNQKAEAVLAAAAGVASANAAAQTAAPARTEESLTAEALIEAIIRDNAPPPPREGPLPPEIDAASQRPILFRQTVPGGPDDGLSYYGGKPTGPAGLVWPRGKGNEGPPLTFIMQWDCAELAEMDPSGLLPRDGVLYCFLNLDWGNHEEFIEGHHFVHHAGPTESWGEIDPPYDIGPAYGEEGAWQMPYTTREVEDHAHYGPKLLGRFPFTPVAMDYPKPELDPEEGDRVFWAEKWIADAQFALQHPEASGRDVRDIDAPAQPFARPFEAFPHDFGAIRVLAAKMLDDTGKSGRYRHNYKFKELSAEEKTALLDQWQEEARELYLFACQQSMGAKVPQDLSDQVWEWQESRKAFIFDVSKIVDSCVNLSLGIGSKGLASVPQEWIDRAMKLHEFASDYTHDEHFDESKHGTRDDWMKMKEAGELDRVRTVHAPTPNHMFGPPSFVQGYVEEYMDTHLLLLELTGYDGPEHHFGEGVLQYLITPEDLAAGRFDKVISVLSGY